MRTTKEEIMKEYQFDHFEKWSDWSYDGTTRFVGWEGELPEDSILWNNNFFEHPADGTFEDLNKHPDGTFEDLN